MTSLRDQFPNEVYDHEEGHSSAGTGHDHMTRDEIERSVRPPSLPYAGSSGWSGSEASRERAERRDSSGKTALLQTQVEAAVQYRGMFGMTIKEVRDDFPEHHHGSLSGTLTDLHKDGRLLRLAEKRDRCSVYVHPRYLMGREVVPPKARLRSKEVVLTPDMNAEFIGHLVIAALNERDEITVRRVQ